MHLVQTIPVTSRAFNNVVLDVIPTMALLRVRQARGAGGHGDEPRGPVVVIYPAEIQPLIDALAQAQAVLAAEPATPAPTR